MYSTLSISAVSHLFFALGREPHLSIAEIAAVGAPTMRDWPRAVVSPHALTIPVPSGPSELDDVAGHAFAATTARMLMRLLGGSTKVGVIWRQVPIGDMRDHAEAIGDHILRHTTEAQKVHFGYSIYDLGGGRQHTDHVTRALHRGAIEMKRWLNAHTRSVRYVPAKNGPRLSSVVVASNHLLPESNGVEMLVGVTADRLLLGQTIAVQPYEEWGAIDFGRPVRDARSGMLPPKLARIMLNLARVPEGGSVLDPFCGSGTILTEAMRIGIPRIIGSDLAPRAVSAATENTTWVGARIGTQHAITITQNDVRELATSVTEKVDAIVTEPYLGAARPSARQQITRETGKLHELYVAAFTQFAKVLRPGGRVVFVVPVFRSGGRERSIDITRDVGAIGFARFNPFPEAIREAPMLAGKEELPYARPDQRVGRRILAFQYQP